jgi:hypothetical protein
MKKIIVCMLFAVMATGAFAQEKGKVRTGFDFGYYHKAGLGLDINLLYNIQDNMNVGVRWGGAFVGKESQTEKKYFDAGITNLSGSYNYYFKSEDNFSAAFVGGGLGWYKLGYGGLGCSCAVEQRIQKYRGNKFGGFLTAGIEGRKCRLALEYNLIPSSEIMVNYYDLDSVNSKNDKVKNSYFAITAGFFIGGGKWKK